jgi:CBS domain-containing protein
VVGFVAERDIVKALEASREQAVRLPVQQVMRRPAPTCGSEDSLQEVMARMTRDRLRHLVVVDAGRIAGVISVGDIVKYRLEQLETETGVLRDYVAAQRAGT